MSSLIALDRPKTTDNARAWYDYALAELGQIKFAREDKEELTHTYRGMVWGFGLMLGYTPKQISFDSKLAIDSALPVLPKKIYR